MELELEFSSPRWNVVLIPIVLLVLIGIGAIGRTVTPQGERILTPNEWRVLKAERAYRQELDTMRRDAETLIALLNGQPEPVRAQLVAERIAQDAGDGQTSLAYQREMLVQAALAVRDWAVGAGEREQAEQSLGTAISALGDTRNE